MRRDDHQYRLGIVVDHNKKQIKNGGSCIFLHVQKGIDAPTAGCTSMRYEDLKTIVAEKCGENWMKNIENISNTNQFPINVSTNKVFLKFVLTDFEDNVSEKTITFTVPKHEN